ncbi:UbiA family prenyltransferase [Candidatus Woesearchaeota archaeon]|nr:UbiA family prenyltransferase [Candidatus Woesearchaeota archaeon]
MIKDLIKLARPHQYYKNLVIFLPLVFAKQLFNLSAIQKTVYGFFILCLVSSVNYIINDLIDIKQDKAHPEKRTRPLASGRITKLSAVIIASLLLIVSFLSSFNLSLMFFIFVLSLFITGTFYSLILKNEPFIDVVIIAINFVIRAVSGAFVISQGNLPYVKVSQWLIFCPFFLSLFLSVSKRESDLKLLGKKSVSHKKVLGYYNLSLTKALTVISTTILIIVYSLYIFFSEFTYLLFSLPVSLYVIFRYLYLVESGSKITRHPHLIYKDKKIFSGILLWAVIAFISVYFL